MPAKKAVVLNQGVVLDDMKKYGTLLTNDEYSAVSEQLDNVDTALTELLVAVKKNKIGNGNGKVAPAPSTDTEPADDKAKK